MNNYWLLPMNYTLCNFKQMETEWNNNKKIMWQVHGKPYKNNKDEWVIKTTKAKSLKKGDIIYFYVSNLPSESKENLSRILLRGVIIDEPCPMKYGEVYLNSEKSEIEKNKMILGFSIGNITTLPKELLQKNSFLSYEYLKSKDSNFKKPQGKNWPNNKISHNFNNELIDILEECFKKTLYRNDFILLIDHFKKKCFFCNKYGNNHKTFEGRNGIDYYEYHHFIPRHKANQISEIKYIIDEPANGLCLCSNCHNKIHYGAIKDVNEMLKIALEDDGIQNMLNKFNFQSYIGQKENIFEWFKDTYNSNM